MDEPTDEDRRNYAESVIKETTKDLHDINKTISDRTLESIREVRSWQRNLITLDFAVLGALAPIFYATGRLPAHKLAFLFGIGLLLFNGIYLLNHQLRTIEKDLRDLPVAMSPTSDILRKRLDAAREAYLEPTNEKIQAIIDAGKETVNHSGEVLTNIAKKERPTFTNDIGIGAFVLGIVLLMRGFVASKLLFWLLFTALVSYFVIKAARDSGEIKKNKAIKLQDVKNLTRFGSKRR